MAAVNLLPTILVADADPDTCALYREAFLARGYDVVEAIDGADALAKALNRNPILIVTEIRLPAIDGYGLCEVLRRDRLTAATPIVVVTAEIRPSELQRAAAAGANAVFTKPASLTALLDQIDLLLRAPLMRETAPADLPGGRRQRLSRNHDRYETIAPPAPPPDLRCVTCDVALTYDSSHVGGVNKRHPEQWDYFVCANGCGRFQYRQRTRQCRRVA